MDNNPTIDASGAKRWYENGVRHRIDGPAVEYTSGAKLWYKNGKLHRTDGPAVENRDGTKLWYLKSEEYTFDEWCKRSTLAEQQITFLRIKYR